MILSIVFILCIVGMLFYIFLAAISSGGGIVAILHTTNRLVIYVIYISKNYECADFVYDSGE